MIFSLISSKQITIVILGLDAPTLTFNIEARLWCGCSISIGSNAGELSSILREDFMDGESVNSIAGGNLIIGACLDQCVFSVPFNYWFRPAINSDLKHDFLTLSGFCVLQRLLHKIHLLTNVFFSYNHHKWVCFRGMSVSLESEQNDVPVSYTRSEIRWNGV